MTRGMKSTPNGLAHGLRLFAGVVMVGVFALAAAYPAASAPVTNAAAPPHTDWHMCRTAAQKVERARDMPHALLQAISLVETGRRGPEGRHTAWPWTINAEGKGMRFATKQDAIWAVRRLMADGVRSIDVGCMQINLRFHPRAFTSLDEAFDPAANMAYAASFLQNLKDRHGNWRAASARYHSYNPALREKYSARVDKILTRERKVLASLGTVRAPLPSAAEEEGDPITTASITPVADLGLRPTLVPGLRRGLDMPETPKPKRNAISPASETSRQIAAR